MENRACGWILNPSGEVSSEKLEWSVAQRVRTEIPCPFGLSILVNAPTDEELEALGLRFEESHDE